MGQPGRQRRRFVAEQRQQALAASLHAERGQPAGPVERGLARGQVPLAQQPAGARREARVEEMARQSLSRAVHHRRGQAVAAFHVGLGREVLQVDPDGVC